MRSEIERELADLGVVRNTEVEAIAESRLTK